jgi:hypothetical protein
MPLPNLEKTTPVFDIIIPSSGQTVKFRPFLVKEEKLLLMALQEHSESEMLTAICQVIEQCAMSPIKVNSLAMFDVQYIFLKIRIKSVGSTSDLSYRCQNKVTLSLEEGNKRKNIKNRRVREDGTVFFEGAPKEGEIVTAPCDNVVKITLNLDAIEMVRSPEHTKTILMTSTLGVTMTYPNVEMGKRLSKVVSGEGTITEAIDGIAYCVESVFDDTNVYNTFSHKEAVEFLEQLTQMQFGKIQAFFETMPTLAHDVPFHCSKCGYSETIHLEGLPAFFE